MDVKNESEMLQSSESEKLGAAGKDPKQPKLDFSKQKGKPVQESTSTEPSATSSNLHEGNLETPVLSSAVVIIPDSNGNDRNRETIESSGAVQLDVSEELVVVNNEKDQDVSFTFLGQNTSLFEKTLVCQPTPYTAREK